MAEVQLSDDVFFLQSSQTVVEFTAYDVVNSDKNAGRAGDFKYAKAGADNNLPTNMIKLVTDNDSKPELLGKVASYFYGSGPQLYRRIIENGKIRIEAVVDARMEDWAEAVELDDYYLTAAYQWAYFAQVFTEFGLSAFGQVKRLKCRDFVHTRAEVIDPRTGRIPHYLICDDWSKGIGDLNPLKSIRAYVEGIEQYASDFMMQAKLPVPGQVYYGFANWWGSTNWTKVDNIIPLFHAAGLKNGYNIKYHVRVPKNYWERYPEKQREAKKKEFRERMDKSLAGQENASKTIVSDFEFDPISGKVIPGLEIIPLTNVNPDKSYLELAKLAKQFQASSHGINPKLAGVDQGGSLGSNSSEIRLAHQYTIATLTPIPRKQILKSVNLACKINGFNPDFFFGHRDVELTTLDSNPTGTQNVTAQ
jgi:hypothetical protein